MSGIMEYIVESENYHLNKKDETVTIDNINNLFESFENLFKSSSDEMNQTKIIEASIICEAMLNLLIKKEGYLLKNASFNSMIEFSKVKEIVPNECISFVQIIKKYRNETAHGIETSKELTSTFLNAFIYFISWYNNSYSIRYNTPAPFNIDSCIKAMNFEFSLNIESLDSEKNTCPQCGAENKNSAKFCTKCGYTLSNEIHILSNKAKKSSPFKRKRSAVKSAPPERFSFSKANKKSFGNPTESSDDTILHELQLQNESLKKILETVLETNELAKNINAKIDIISEKLDFIQSHTEKLIKNAWSEDEIDRIIQAHTASCIESIMENSSDLEQDIQFDSEKIRLIDKFGEKTWNKLSDESQTFLVTSKFMYTKLLGSAEIIDYSGICVLVTKALEVEIFKRFFSNFIAYLEKTYEDDYSKYPTALLFQNKKPLHPERFTMGNIAYVLCLKENYRDTPEQKLNNKSVLMEYCKKGVFSRYGEDEIEDKINQYASSIEDIRIKYRNPSAHRNQIGKKDAKDCLDLIIDVEKLLKRMLDSFDN